MIFNEMKSNTDSDVIVNESPYELGIGGALMHVYENECNYNALMKAAALSELKYYNENGGDLFVQEAGAFSGFLAKIKAFFLKVIEKIKSIAHKFMAKVNQYTMSDKDFVKKYQTEILRRDLKDFEFTGYKFPKFNAGIEKDNKVLVNGIPAKDADQDTLNEVIEKNRGKIVGGSAMTESEYRDALKEKLYGDKDSFPVVNREQLDIITKTKDDIKAVEDDKKSIIKAIEDIIKATENTWKADNKALNDTVKDLKDDVKEEKEAALKLLDHQVYVWKAYSNDLTVYFGAKAKSLVDRNRQAKAICVKALSYKAKNESASVEESAYGNIFAGVEIL